ncbi:Ltp family lipoprotein [Bogoriella caseilytica]|uniref:Host cell surface-exposed lipoprotein n=1 Tax=Bogoriella caseilytica TaxID=56055 RepID=A0A3N2BAU7_9MICO|nr:Ltp family lipoprotein [Bogoriella caseilytica]ROR72381.1 host cell surface-exposed lipoprotein [Bogoriella caseilytica]
MDPNSELQKAQHSALNHYRWGIKESAQRTQALRAELREIEAESAGVVGRNDEALSSADSYLDSMPFSRAGLIGQLEHDGYSSGGATLAVDQVTVDWREQAVRAAESYLETMPFSRAGLIGQLEHDGYSSGGATLAVDQVTVDWRERAVRAAESYLETMPFSRAGLIGQLEHDGYSTGDATLAVHQVAAE